MDFNTIFLHQQPQEEQYAPSVTDSILIGSGDTTKTIMSEPVHGHGGGDDTVYYSVFSVAVLTLGLLLLVELLTHHLENSASNHPFYKATVEQVYRELGTLGIVELFIHLLHEYYEDLDVTKEALFADVHFVIFYTAIFNAFQSAILSFLSTRISYRMWVETEELEINHYVEIREEFDKLDRFFNGTDQKEQEQEGQEQQQQENDDGDDRTNHTGNHNDNIGGEGFQRGSQNNSTNRTYSAAVAMQRERVRRRSSVWGDYQPAVTTTTLTTTPTKTATTRTSGGGPAAASYAPFSSIKSHDINDGTAAVVATAETDDFNANNDPVAGRRSNSAGTLARGVIKVVFDNMIKCCCSVNARKKQLYESIRYSHQIAKYNQLLLKVRFHELRLHLLKSENLPPQLKVSGYLMRSEQAVLIQLIRVKVSTWLYLLGAMNVLYYYLGMITDITMDNAIIGQALTGIYFMGMLLFGLFSIALYHKMQRVFLQIMHMEILMEEEEEARHEIKEIDLAKEQLHLFWFAEPKFIITAIQMMQFGFAISLSVIIVFWETLQDGILTGSTWTYLIPLILCFLFWMSLMPYVIPQYTLCTGLGRLVDKQRLHETVAKFHLASADQKRREQQNRCLRQTSIHNNDDKNNHYHYHPYYDISEEQFHSCSRSRPCRRKTVSVGAAAISGMSHNTSKPLDASSSLNDKKSISGNIQTANAQKQSPNQEQPKGTDNGMGTIRHEEKSHSDNNAVESDLGNPSSIKDVQAAKKKRKSNEVSVERASILSELVTKDTRSLRQLIPHEEKKILDNKKKEGHIRRHKNGGMSDAVVATQGKVETTREVLSDSTNFNGVNEKVIQHDFVEKELPQHHHQQQQQQGQQQEDLEAATDSSSTGTLYWRRLWKVAASRQGENGDFSNCNPEEESLNPLSESEHNDGHTEVDNDGYCNSKSPERHPGHGQDEGSCLVHFENLTVVEEGEKGEGEADNDTIDTVLSGHSDTNDVPEVDVLQKARHLHDFDPPKCPLRAYFVSDRYKIVSNLFGTMACFFLVGMRIEGFVSAAGILVEENTPDLSLMASFWLETALLILFILGSILIIYMLHYRAVEYNAEQRTAIYAAVIDFFTSVICLILLMVAESQRCDCKYLTPHDGHGYDNSYGYGYNDDHGYGDNNAYDDHHDYGDDHDDHHRFLAREGDEYEGSCCTFGSRTSSGDIGNIEPFTGLILFRVLRFFLAHKVQKFLYGMKGHSDTRNKQDDEATKGKFNTSGYCTNGIGREKGAAVELWELAVSKFPEIVEKHGEFSGQLLQAMLGIDIIAEEPPATKGVAVEREVALHTLSDSSQSNHTSMGPFTDASRSSNALHSERRYSTLSREVQGIILPRKFGSLVQPSRDLISMHVRDEKILHGSLGNYHIPPNSENLSDSLLSTLAYPNSKLVRSMRRCYKKLLPFLDEWTPVDVVITKYEIVYFEVISENVQNVADFMAEALILTKGGKGLRLCDVAVGRKVCGKLLLSDIVQVHVDREFPVPGVVDDIEEDQKKTDFMRNEFWQPMRVDRFNNSVISGPNETTCRPSRLSRWKNVVQDKLNIQTISGNLHLRFFSDLEDNEVHPERIAEEKCDAGPIFKNNAFQWAQTIVRLCGLDQLKQPLPNYGTCDSNELRDYVRIIHPHCKPQGNHHQLTRSQSMLAALGLQLDYRSFSFDNGHKNYSRQFCSDHRFQNFLRVGSHDHLNNGTTTDHNRHCRRVTSSEI